MHAPTEERDELPVFEGRTIKAIYGNGRPTVVAPFYPLYTPEEHARMTGHPLYYRYRAGHDESHLSGRYLNHSAQATRAVPFAGEVDSMLLPESADVPLLLEYFHATYGDAHVARRETLKFYEGPDGYRSALPRELARTRGKLVSLHPFLQPDVEADGYYNDPRTLAWLNDKRNIGELTDKVPARREVPLAGLAEAVEAAGWERFFLKEGNGSGGDTLFFIDPRKGSVRKQIDVAVLAFFERGVESIIVEEYFDHDRSYNVQLHVDEAGTVTFMHASEQFSENGAHTGNEIDLGLTQKDIPPAVLAAAVEIAEAARDKGAEIAGRRWHGMAGLDILHRQQRAGRDEAVAFHDPNFRWTASTTVCLLREPIAAQAAGPLVQTASLYPHDPSMTIEEAIRALRGDFLDRGKLFLIGGARAPEGHEVPFKFYAAVAGKSREEIARTFREVDAVVGVH